MTTETGEAILDFRFVSESKARRSNVYDGSQFHATLLTQSCKQGVILGLVKTPKISFKSSCSTKHSNSCSESGIDELCSCEYQKPIKETARKKSTEKCSKMAKDDIGPVRCVRVTNGDLKKTLINPKPDKEMAVKKGSKISEKPILLSNKIRLAVENNSSLPKLKSPSIVKEVMKSIDCSPKSLPANINGKCDQVSPIQKDQYQLFLHNLFMPMMPNTSVDR